MKRRKFIKDIGLVSTSLYIPGFLGCSASKKSLSAANNGKKLVIIQLSGGNDGFNCIFPHRNDDYYKLRPTIALKNNEIEYLNDEYALNKSMLPLKKYYDSGEMNILNRVGYPNPSLSHFRSMDVWHSASTNLQKPMNGWLGRYLDSECDDLVSDYAINIEDGLSLALRGANTMGIAIGQNPLLTEKMYKSQKLFQSSKTAVNSHKDLQYLYKLQNKSSHIHHNIGEALTKIRISSGFNKDHFSKKLGYITKMILSDLATKVYYVEIKGFDTHANQKNRQNKLLSSLSFGLDQFIKELKRHNLFDETLVFVFSEFGRRLSENKSKGTDHGKGNCAFLFGGKLINPGIYNELFTTPSITEKNLSYQIDFRSIYATILEKWLQSDSQAILGNNYKLLNILS